MMGKMSDIPAGLQHEYLEGLENLRKLITDVECDIDKVKRDFYKCTENDENQYEAYLKKCNDKLLYCNNKLRKNNVELKVIDGEVQLVALLNDVRDLNDNFDPEVISFLSEFWEHSKDTLDSLKMLKIKYERTVLKRLKSSCISYNNGIKLDLTQNYNLAVTKYQEDITKILKMFDQLAKSFENHIKQDLFTNTNFTDRVLVLCDQKAFPILRLVPDLTEKIMSTCGMSRQWVDKDETYVHDINCHIREARNKTRQDRAALKNQQEKKSEMSKDVANAYGVFKTNRLKFKRIETELKQLESQMVEYSKTKQYKSEERKQKEGIVGFLDISISQTKKNFSLQLKKSRLMRQLRELEETLTEIERELTSVDKEIKEKSQEKESIAEKMEESNTSYKTLKTEMTKLVEDVSKLQENVSSLTESLTQLETIQTFKTRPENVEDFYDRPVAVKLAPSLKEKIQRRRKGLVTKDAS